MKISAWTFAACLAGGCARESGDGSADAGGSDSTDATTAGTSDDGSGACNLDGLTITHDQAIIAFDYWTHDSVLPRSVALELNDLDCQLQISAAPAWLDASIGASTGTGATAELVLKPQAVVAGISSGTVEIAGEDGVVRATLVVELHALLEGVPGAKRRVIVLGVDGLRPDAVELLELPTFDALMERGQSTLSASTQLATATKSGPGWASILTGVEASKHLVDSNDDLAEIDRDYPTMLARLAGLGFDVASVGNWPGIASLIEDEVSADSYFGQEATVAEEAMVRIDNGSEFIFVQFDSVDVYGHAYGFDPEVPQYAKAVRDVDQLAGKILTHIVQSAALSEEDWLIVLVTDHAGFAKDHGPQEAVYQTIPLALASPSRPAGSLDGMSASHLDVAPTVFEFLGVSVDPLWDLDGTSRW